MPSVRYQGDIIAVPAAGPLILGRHSECQVRIAHDEASRRHARMTSDDYGGVSIEDLGSLNGTWVNGQRIGGRTRLNHGDRITICGHAVEYLDPPVAHAMPADAAAASTAKGPAAATAPAPSPNPPPAGPKTTAPALPPSPVPAPVISTRQRAKQAETLKMAGDHVDTATRLRRQAAKLKWLLIITAALLAGCIVAGVAAYVVLKPAVAAS
jgi:predicted component of type VI protein secretion system